MWPSSLFSSVGGAIEGGQYRNRFFDQAAVQNALIPGVLGFVLTAAVRLANGRTRGPLVAGAAVALSFAAVYFLLIGIPPHPPVSDLDKLVYGVAGGVTLGFCLDVLRLPPFIR